RILPVFHEPLAHGAARIRRDILHRRRVRGGSHDHDGIFHRAVLFQRGDQPGDLALTLADSHVNALHPQTLLVDDGVNRNRGLTRLAVANNQLTLAAPDRDHRVNRDDTCLHRAVYVTAIHHAGGNPLDVVILGEVDRPFAVYRVAERIHNTPHQPFTHRHRG